YASIFQFMHPGVHPSIREGYLALVKNAFFFADSGTDPFFLSPSNAEAAWQGSLNLQRNFTYNMQAFAFKRSFLDSMRVDGCIFQSQFPDYYLANFAMAKGKRILISHDPLTVAGISTASYGYTLFNDLEKEGADLLHATYADDSLYPQYRDLILPGSSYRTNFIITMGHVARNIGANASTARGSERYRKIQTLTCIESQRDPKWMKSTQVGRKIWESLSLSERVWAAWVGYQWSRGVAPKNRENLRDYAFAALQERIATGEFARLAEVYEMLDRKPKPVVRKQVRFAARAKARGAATQERPQELDRSTPFQN